MTAAKLFTDFGWMSILLVVSHLIRYYVKPLQRWYIPSSIIAGFIGLFFGYQFLNIIPFAANDSGSPFMSGYPTILIVVLYSTLFFGGKKKGSEKASFKTTLKNVGDTFFNCWSVQVGQYGVTILLGLALIATLFPDLHAGFASLMPAGFIGGHGVATSIGTFYADNGWEDAMTVGYTFATAGLLIGLFGGIIMINIACRKGWTRFIKSPAKLPKYMLSAFVPEEKRESAGNNTVHSISLESLTWHLSLLLAAYVLGNYMVKWIALIWPDTAVPQFATAMVAGFFIQKFLDLIGLGEYVDKKTMGSIGSCATDYLVAFAVATMNVNVVIKYAAPLSVLCLFGILYCVFWTLWIGPRIYHNYWFERSIFVYGFATGVMATGVTLLRVVDPDAKSGPLEDYGVAYVFLSFLSIIIPIVVPAMILQGQGLLLGIVSTVLALAGLILSKYLVGWFTQPKDQLREGEVPIKFE